MYGRVEQGRQGCNDGTVSLTYDTNKGRVFIGEG